jgi:hypothetical protein
MRAEFKFKVKLPQRELDKAFKELEAEVGDIVRGMTVGIWDRVVQRTPQYEGSAAASWTYSLNQPVFVSRNLEQAFPSLVPRQQGHPVAVNLANFQSKGADKAFKLGDTVYFGNGVDIEEGPYASGLEDGTIRLRSVNRPGRMAGRAVGYFVRRFEKNVSPATAAKWRAMTIGGSRVGDT